MGDSASMIGAQGLRLSVLTLLMKLIVNSVRMARDPEIFENKIVVSLNLVIHRTFRVLGKKVNATT